MHVCGEDEPGSQARNGRCRHAGPCAGSATGNRSAEHGGHAHRAVESSAVADGRAALRLEYGPALVETRQLERSPGQAAAALGIPFARRDLAPIAHFVLSSGQRKWGSPDDGRM